MTRARCVAPGGVGAPWLSLCSDQVEHACGGLTGGGYWHALFVFVCLLIVWSPGLFLVGLLVLRLVTWPVIWFSGWLVGCLVGWLVGWSADWPTC